MAYRNLTPQAMVNVSAPWLDPEKDRKVFTALPLLAALLPVVEEAHDGLKTTQRLSSSVQQRLKGLLDRATALDARHDRKMRGAYNYLGALAEMTDDPELAAAILDLRDRLVPAGLKATNRSYSDQAGDAKLLPSRLDEASSKLLRKLKTPDGPLSEVVDAWVAAALELEEVEAERVKLTQELQGDPNGVTPKAMLNAKNTWIRAARAIESNLALEKGATPAIVERLLGRLHLEEAKADRRALVARKGGGTPDEAGDTAAAEPEPPQDTTTPSVG